VVALEKALEVDPKHWKAHNNMALASVDIGELELAEAHYRESLAIEPQPAIYNDLGFVLERQGLPFEAVEMYRKSLELDPDSAAAHFNLAASLTRSGDFVEAEPHFRAALAKDPGTRAYTGLGIVQWQQGRADEAIESMRAAIEADPDNAAAYDQLGKMLAQRGKLQEAASVYRSLIRLRPSATAHRELSQILTHLGRTDEAHRELETARALEHRSAAVQ
jgi:superkiller protein 3